MIMLLIESTNFCKRNRDEFISVTTYKPYVVGGQSPTHFWLDDGMDTIEPIDMIVEYIEPGTYKAVGCRLFDTAITGVEGNILDKKDLICLVTQTY
jgi:hypothetical protein